MDIGALLAFVIPPYFANAVPVVLGGGTPLDLGKTFFDGRAVFGPGKTIRGVVAGLSAGIVASAVVAFFLGRFWFWIGCLASFGALLGDVFGSFLKRRLGLEGAVLGIDQLTFIVFALAFAYPLTKTFITPLDVIIIILVTFVTHILANKLAYALGWKNVPW